VFDILSFAPTTVAIAAFLSLSAFSVSLVLLARSLFFGETVAETAGSRRIRRMPTVFDQTPATSLLGRFDQGFDRLILESGLQATPSAFFLLMLSIGLLSGGTIYLVFNEIMTGILVMGVAMLLAMGVVFVVRDRRLKAIKTELPLTLDLMARAVRAGESLDQALELIGEESRGPIGSEFCRVTSQLNMGMAMPAVMKSFTSRTPLMEIRILASTLLVHRKTGGQLADALERMSSVVRDRINYQRQMKASTGAGRMSALIIATISPVLYGVMIFWKPEHFQVLLTDPVGQSLLTLAAVLETVGIVWVYRSLKVD